METLSVPIATADELAAMTWDGRARLLDTLNRAARQVEAAIVDLVDASDRAVDFAVDGHRSTSAWLRATTNCTGGEAKARVQSAHALRTLSDVRDEFRAGRVGVAQVREIGRLHANPRCGDQLPDAETILLAAAKNLDYSAFKTVTERWQQLADADGAHAAHQRANDFRDAQLLQVGSEFRFETSHGIIHGTAMREVFDAFVEAEFDRDWQATVAKHGELADTAQLPRTPAQRRADAFMAMIVAAAATGASDSKPIDVVVNLISDLDQFERQVEAELTDTPAEIDPATVRDRRCETTDGIPVDPRQLVAAAFAGRIRHVVTDGAGIVVAAGRKQRLFTGALREAIQAIDPACGWLGCGLRAQLAEIDHLEPAARGGPTDGSNGKVMCKKHNLFKHHHNYAVRRQPDGTITITRPDGTPIRLPDAA